MAKAPRAQWTVDVSVTALALAALTVVVGLSVGLVFGVASALLAFVTGALLGGILLVWHSLRTLAGDADVDAALELATSASAPTELDERKRRALRALKDIEQEHAVGKLDDRDFAALDTEYRARAKAVFREMDAELEPYRAKAEALVRVHLEQRHAEGEKSEQAQLHACAACDTTNDADATFCKKCGAKLMMGAGH